MKKWAANIPHQLDPLGVSSTLDPDIHDLGVNVFWTAFRNEDGEIIEKVGTWENEEEAKSALDKSESKDDLELRIRTEKTNDKSGKATPIDRILVIAPDSANPKSLLEVEEVSWSPFLTSAKISKLSDFE